MIISIVLLAFQLLIVGLGVLLGYKRGIGRGVVRLVELVVMGVVSFFLGRFLSDLFAHKAWAAISPLLGADIVELISASPALNELIVGFVGALFVPFIFALLFSVMGLISLILLKKRSVALVRGITKRDEDMSKKSNRLIGLGIGAVSAVLVALVLCSPAYTALSLVGGLSDESIAFIGDMTSTDAETPDDPEGTLSVRPTLLKNEGFDVESFLLELRAASGKLAPALSLHLTGHDTPHGDHYDAIEEAYTLINVVATAIAHTKECEESGTADAMTKVTHIAQASLPMIAGHAFAKELVADAAVAVGSYLQDGGELAGISSHTGDYVTDLMVDAMAEVLVATTVENLSDTTNTLFGVDLDQIEEDQKNGVTTPAPEETKAPETKPEGSKPTTPSDDTSDKPVSPDKPTKPNDSDKPNPSETTAPETTAPRVPVKTTQGALAILSSINLNNASTLFMDDDSCLSLIEAVYLLDSNPTFAPIVNALGDLGQKMLSENSAAIMPNLTETSVRSLYEALVMGVTYEKAMYGNTRTLEDRANDIKYTLQSVVQTQHFQMTDYQAELAAICLTIHFYTEENMENPGNITFEAFKEYFGIRDLEGKENAESDE